MGLSGRKVKQRIPNDPRNLSWADDAARFGSNYLAKFGWDSSKGLGVDGEGRTSHIKVSQKLDMLGIGAAHQQDPNGLAWKQNKDFESLLKRLNETTAKETPADEKKEDTDREDAHVEEEDGDEGEKKRKKRKHGRGEGDGERDQKKKRKDKTETIEVVKVQEIVEEKTEIVSVQVKTIVPRHRAHRARAIAAKDISSKSASHISEILGIAPSPSTSTREQGVDHSQGKLTDTADTEGLTIEKITTSAKSVTDYFKEKLVARSAKTSGASTPLSPGSSYSPAETSDTSDDVFDAPRMGLGSSRLRLEVHSETKDEEDTRRIGLSKFSSLMSSSFLASTTSYSALSTSFIGSSPPKEEEGTTRISEVEPEITSTDKKREKKNKRKRREKDFDACAEPETPDDHVVQEKKSKGKRKAEPEDKQEKELDEAEKNRHEKKKRKKKRVRKSDGVARK
ncbi:hypothetical protein NLJ89_g620 [Agrocybe chaxingu]|uniref:G-patch domain-containing protein n=1 Tax=Agrocybe chaxingu TaxID=84603 RepID=A0A9W8N1N9_9AGAR|nr:hypothetical protein NLJ89_g620 [Agrocybe chaxingu]